MCLRNIKYGLKKQVLSKILMFITSNKILKNASVSLPVSICLSWNKNMTDIPYNVKGGGW